MSRSSARGLTTFLCGLAILGGGLLLWPQAKARKPAVPVIGKSARYCNPLPLETSSSDGSPQGVNLGDVTDCGSLAGRADTTAQPKAAASCRTPKAPCRAHL